MESRGPSARAQGNLQGESRGFEGEVVFLSSFVGGDFLEDVSRESPWATTFNWKPRVEGLPRTRTLRHAVIYTRRVGDNTCIWPMGN